MWQSHWQWNDLLQISEVKRYDLAINGIALYCIVQFCDDALMEDLPHFVRIFGLKIVFCNLNRIVYIFVFFNLLPTLLVSHYPITGQLLAYSNCLAYFAGSCNYFYRHHSGQIFGSTKNKSFFQGTLQEGGKLSSISSFHNLKYCLFLSYVLWVSEVLPAVMRFL